MRAFATTHWSLVLVAGGEDEEACRALAELCQAYWTPLYYFIRRRVGNSHEAQDLTQAFFQQLLERRSLASADPHRGRFRSFLITACKRFLVNEWHKGKAVKRGGRESVLSLDFALGESNYPAQAVDSLTPERLFEQQWAITLLARVLQRLRDEYTSRDKAREFENLKPFLTGTKGQAGYAQAAERLATTETAAKVAAHRMRVRYRELLRDEIAQTVQTAEEVEDEIRSLFLALGSERA